MYLGWYDDNPKKTPALKIAEAIAAYVARFETYPTVILCNEADCIKMDSILVRSESYIRPNNFWVGEE